MNHWYVIKTKPKKEEGVRSQLEKVTLDIFFPKIKGLSIRKRIGSVTDLMRFKPLFPSYLFVRADFQDPKMYRLVSYTRGVSRILGNSEGPISVSDEIVETLRDRTSNGSLIEQNMIFKEGDRIRVKTGILKDLYGIIEKNISPQGRVQILFKWLSGRMKASLWYTELEKVT